MGFIKEWGERLGVKITCSQVSASMVMGSMHPNVLPASTCWQYTAASRLLPRNMPYDALSGHPGHTPRS